MKRELPAGAECRFLPAAVQPVQLRAAEGDQPAMIEGYGAVFYSADDPGTEFRLWQNVYERIAPGAFDRALKEDDVRSFFNHDSNIVLGRTKANTLSLSVDEIGLRYVATPPDTQLVRDQVLSPIKRGDVTGSSFMFIARKVAWIEESRGDVTIEIREIQEAELFEVGPVAFPAYEATTTGLRAGGQSIEAIRAEHAAWRAAQTGAHAAADFDLLDIDYRWASIRANTSP